MSLGAGARAVPRTTPRRRSGCETPTEARVALDFGAQGIGLFQPRVVGRGPAGRPGVERCRIVEPVRGWVSRRCLKSVADLTSEEPSVVVSGGPGPPAL